MSAVKAPDNSISPATYPAAYAAAIAHNAVATRAANIAAAGHAATRKRPEHMDANPKTLSAPIAQPQDGLPHVVAQPPGLNFPPALYNQGRYIQERPQTHHVAWSMDQAPWMDFEQGLDGGPVGQ